MARRTDTQANRSQLKALLESDPSLIAELRAMVLAEDDEADDEPETRSYVFEGNLEDATFTQTRKSLKFDGTIPVIDGFDGKPEDGPKAIVVVYLPPEVATEEIIVSVIADGAATEGREVAGRKRSKAS